MVPLDWLVVAAYFCVVLVFGLSRRRNDNVSEYFLAARSIGFWSVAISIIATETSAATFIGGPDTSYRGDVAYVQTTIGAVLSRFFLAYFFIDHYYRTGVYTVYGFLEQRFGVTVQKFTAVLFCVGRLFASGARLYIASFALSTIVGFPLVPTVIVVGVAAMIYSVLGGLRAVIRTDIIQGVLFLATGVFVLFYLCGELGGVGSAVSTLSGSGKLELFHLDLNIFSIEFWQNPYTLIGAVIGGFTLGVATHGTDQDMVQRMLACRTSREGRRSLVIAGLLEIPVVILFVTLGLLLWAFYQQPGNLPPPVDASVFPHFIANVLPDGLRGLLVAGIFAAAMSSLDSAITALASVSVADLWMPLRRGEQLTKESSDAGLYSLSRNFSALWGVLLVVTAIVLGLQHQALLLELADSADRSRQAELLTLALGVMGLLYGPLLGIFLVAIFTKRGSPKSVIFGALAGLLVVVLARNALSFELGWTWHVVLGCLVTVVIGAAVDSEISTDLSDGR